MARILLILHPDLRISMLRVVNLLRGAIRGYRGLLLDLPSEMEDAVNGLARGETSYDEFLEEVERGGHLPEPMGAWEYTFRPLLEALPRISPPGFMVRCYGSREREFARVEAAVRIAQLTLRAALRGRVEVDEWRDILNRSIGLEEEAISEGAKTIGEIARGDSICLAEMGGIGLRKHLSRSGFDVEVFYVERPYHFTPLAILKRRMGLGPVEDGEIERLVRCHVEYIRNYIYRFENRDRAYYEWIYDKIPWLRGRMKREEIDILSRILEHPS